MDSRPALRKPGVFIAHVQGEGVLFDLPDNRYIGLTWVSAQIWNALEPGATVRSIAESIDDEETSLEEKEALVREQLDIWFQSDLLVERQDERSDSLPIARCTTGASRDLSPDDLSRTRLSPRALGAVTRSALWASQALRRRPLAALLRYLQTITTTTDADYTQIVLPTIRAYEFLRKPFHSGNEDCLPRSLALTFALRKRRVDAAICFGVRKFPFGAHAWVEAHGRIVNDRLDYIRNFERIAAF